LGQLKGLTFIILNRRRKIRRRNYKGFRIFRNEPYQKTYIRLIAEQVTKTLNLTKLANKDPDYATHEIRKCSKRIRAVIRLFRFAMDETSYQQSIIAFRDLNKMLATHRISAANIEILKKTAADKRYAALVPVINRIILVYQEDHRNITHEMLTSATHVKLGDMIRENLNTLKKQPLVNCKFSDILKGLKLTYKRCRNNLDRAIQEPLTENLHAFRKSVKMLWNQLVVLKPVWPPVIGQTVHYLDLLGERLGYEHDLAELEHSLQQKGFLQQPEYKILKDFITKRRIQVQHTIWQLALKLFAENPGTFAAKMNVYHHMYVSGRK
jgi:CHAD domain-containing protein